MKMAFRCTCTSLSDVHAPIRNLPWLAEPPRQGSERSIACLLRMPDTPISGCTTGQQFTDVNSYPTMAFSKTIKEETLVAAGRRCCLCTRYKGVRLEVHHIVPTSDGGTDDYDNAIALCFDCHADVGHYNPHHPRGNRFTPTELRKHRRRLYRQIEYGTLSSTSPQAHWAYCRYLICKSFSALSEIINGDLACLPVASPLLADTIALANVRDTVHVQGSDTRGSNVHGDWFPDGESYCVKHSSAQVLRASDPPDHSYFQTIRMPDEAEIRTRVGPSDPLSMYLLDAGASSGDVCVALGCDDACGGGFQELYKTRPIWTAFLEIKNISTDAVTLRHLHGALDITERDYREFVIHTGTSWSMPLPSAAILPDHSVLVPLGVLLGPLRQSLPSAIRSEDYELAPGHYQEVDRVDYSSVTSKVGLLGPMIWPSSITATFGNASVVQQLHELDMANLYTIDRHWAMGSCPFLFLRSQDDRLTYVRELFAEKPTVRSHDTITVPQGIRSMIVAELEREITYIESMRVNGRRHSVNLELHRGDCWELSVRCNDEIQLVGWYCPELPGRQDPLYHDQLICNFIDDQDAPRSRQR